MKWLPSAALARVAVLPCLPAAILVALTAAPACDQSRSDTRSASTVEAPTPPVEALPTPGVSAMPDAETIGTAWMKPDRTIVLQLRASDGTGRVGDALVEYPPTHPQYQEVLQHVGGLRPGEHKAVPPWP